MFIGHMDNPDTCGEWIWDNLGHGRNGEYRVMAIANPFCGHFGIVLLCFSGQNKILILSDAGIGEKPKGVPSPIQ